MAWWSNRRFRMVQNNFRDVDCCIDIDQYVAILKSFHADVCMVGCGGITAFHPTGLNCQLESPYLQGDFFGELLEKCHENGIRVIARFDFSKTNRIFLEKHPEWFSQSIEGKPVLFNDTAATCVNGPYQQEKSLEILEEVLCRYPVDGVFFNMFGYQVRDYSNHYVGICQCENCKKRFLEYSGYILPKKEDEADPVFQIYRKFKSYTTEELLKKIYTRVKELNPETAVCTYSNRYVDLVRNESNSAVDRRFAFWRFASEANVSVIRGTYQERFSSNCVINAVDIFYRFMGVSDSLNQLRLYGSMASGGNLDWCIIGGFETYPDSENFDGVKRIFRFHEKYTELFSRMKSTARVLLVCSYGNEDAMEEYKGIFRMLKESHILFDVMDGREQERLLQRLEQYQLVIFAGQQILDDSVTDKLANSDIKILATGLSFENQPEILRRIFHISLKGEIEKIRGSYLSMEPQSVFHHFEHRKWVYLDKRCRYIQAEQESELYLPHVAASMYGPPERCYGHCYTENYTVSEAQHRAVYISWMPGALYDQQGYDDFRWIVLDLLGNGFLPEQAVYAEAPECIEIFFDQTGEKEYLLQLINDSGCNGNTVRPPLPVEAVLRLPEIDIESAEVISGEEERILPAGEALKLTCRNIYEAILIHAQ